MALEEIEHKARALLVALAQEIEAAAANAETISEAAADTAQEAAVEAVDEELVPEIAMGKTETSAPDKAQKTPSLRVQPDAIERIAAQMRAEAEVLLGLSTLERGLAQTPASFAAVRYLLAGPASHAPLKNGEPAVWGLLLGEMAAGQLGALVARDPAAAAACSRSWLDEWLFGKVIADALTGMGIERSAAARSLDLLGVLIGQDGWFTLQVKPQMLAEALLRGWLDDKGARRYLLIHAYDGVEWFNKEAFEELAWWTFARLAVQQRASGTTGAALSAALQLGYAVVQELLRAEEHSGYRIDRLV
jgi:hypothetical protein